MSIPLIYWLQVMAITGIFSIWDNNWKERIERYKWYGITSYIIISLIFMK
jgi:hypothetical protein